MGGEGCAIAPLAGGTCCRVGALPVPSARDTFSTTGDGDARYLGYHDGAQVYEVGAGHVSFRARR